MNAIDFINSKDIREYLEKIEYKFTPLQSTYIIDCSKKPLTEKHEAFRELIANTDDCEIKERRNFESFKSLHKFLEAYIEHQECLTKALYEEEPGSVYCYAYVDRRGYFRDYDVYNCYNACFDDAKHLLMSENEKAEEITKFYIHKKVFKSQFAEAADVIEAEYNSGFELVNIKLNFDADKEKYKCPWKNYNLFEYLWVNIPVPFKKGDIIINRYDRVSENEPMVYTGLITDYKRTESDEKHESRIRRYEDEGDETDMCYYAISVNDTLNVWDDHHTSYLNIEYYNEELTGRYRMLKPISSYMKEEISMDLLINGIINITDEERLEDRSGLVKSWYTDEGLKLAGMQLKRRETENE